MSLWIPLIVSIVSLFAGYALSRFSERSRPWVILESIHYSYNWEDEVVVGREASRASRASLFLIDLEEGDQPFGLVQRDQEIAEYIAAVAQDTDGCLGRGSAALAEAGEERDTREVLLSLLRDGGVSELLDFACYRQLVPIPAFDDGIEPKLGWLRSEERGGCLSFDFPDAVVLLGSGLDMEQHKIAGLAPLAELISRLEREKLRAVFSSLVPLWREQRRANEVFLEHTTPVVNAYARWMAFFAITNFGEAPLLLFPYASIVVRARGRRSFEVPCHLMIADGSGGLSAISGVYVVRPLATEMLALETEQRQRELYDSAQLRQLYRSKDAQACIRLSLKGRNIPWTRRPRSNAIPFAEYLRR